MVIKQLRYYYEANNLELDSNSELRFVESAYTVNTGATPIKDMALMASALPKVLMIEKHVDGGKETLHTN